MKVFSEKQQRKRFWEKLKKNLMFYLFQSFSVFGHKCFIVNLEQVCVGWGKVLI